MPTKLLQEMAFGFVDSDAGREGSDIASTTKPSFAQTLMSVETERWKYHCGSGCPIIPSPLY